MPLLSVSFGTTKVKVSDIQNVINTTLSEIIEIAKNLHGHHHHLHKQGAENGPQSKINK